MADLEKVLAALECCMWTDERMYCDCTVCPYYDNINGHCGGIKQLHEDALALLKAQEPRQITRDEWDQWRHTPDGKRDPLYLQIGKTGGWWILAPEGWIEISFLIGDIKLWDKKPTDEQRKAEAWKN